MPRSSSANVHRVWSRDSNDARRVSELKDASVAAALAAYAPSHSFRRDLLAYCRMVKVTPHPKLIPMHPDEEENQGADTNSGGANVNIYDLSETENVAIKNWQLDEGNCRGLCFALAFCPKIHSLCLFNVMLSRDQLELICQTIPKTQVQILQLEWNFSETHSPAELKADSEVRTSADTVEVESETVTGDSVSVLHDSEKVDAGDDRSTVYAQLLGASSPLVFLSLRSNGITSAGALEIANALRNNTKVQSLNLFQNRVGDDGALAIAHALPQNATLKSISLASNNISGKGAMALISSITRYEAPLALLKAIEDAESKILAEIEHAKKAKKKIDRRTAIANLGLPIFEVIDGIQFAPGNSVLEELILSGNQDITEADAFAMSESLDSFQSKLQTHLRHVKLQRIPSLRPIHQRGHKLSEFIVL